MGKLSPEQAKQLKDLQDLESADDDDFHVWVENSNGHRTRLEGDAARRWLRRNGYDEDDADAASKAEPLDAKGGKGPAKSTPAKKAAPGADEDDEVDQDEPAPIKNKRAFF